MIKEKIKRDEEKELDNAEKQLKFHINTKTKLIKQLKDTNEYKLRIKLKEKINEQKTMIEIWISNINSIKSQLEN
ncbi:MAG: hypothetical protein ACE5GR_08550 [Nitrosopumilus sp.]